MWSDSAPAEQVPPVNLHSEFDSSIRSSVDSFLKDGREVRVGDCALFQALNAPPFIGIIRWFTTNKENCLKLCVNWLYRPADINFAKGILLEAAPNEVFYSFHKDVISAASLLHPCKVAFLGKGVEPPLGISSFICRRVYDIANKCLWWLTDQDYINERQEEVDQLLYKTRLEMHAAVQSGGRSPKPLNGPSSTPQIKSGTDSVQNSGTSFPSHVKGKKRDRRGDQGTEPIKREHSSKLEDGESTSSRLDNMIKAEVAKFTEKGALIMTDDVEKLVHLIQLDRNERKIDFAGRILLADLIAATDKIECLSRFVQLRGVPILDDWLQEAHKGKTGDGGSPKDTDKGTEELLLALLRALDKLPVNLNALQTCNIGKSVNHLRGHKNVEVQKKARSLVDTWKKRVDAEMMKVNDAKSVGSNQPVSSPVKPVFPEVSHAGIRRSGSAETTPKNLINQASTCKTLVGKPDNADTVVKLTPVTPGSLKLPSTLPAPVSISSKDSPGKGAGSSGNSELLLAGVKEEKSSGSSQSQNNGQSYSGDHAKAMNSSWKEDARSSTAGSMNAKRTSVGSSRHRRSANGHLGSSVSGAQKEANVDKTGSLNKVSNVSGFSSERTFDTQGVDHGSSHRLIVRLPNPARSPARSASGGSLEDPSVSGGRTSSPAHPDKYDQIDRKTKLKGDACRSRISTDVNAEPWQSNDVKESVAGCDEGERSPATVLDEGCKGADETGRGVDASRAACSSSVNGVGISLSETKSGNSFGSMNALIESCAKDAEVGASVPSGDDVGINLLANVAAGEISKSGLVSPSASPGSSPKEEPCAANDMVKSGLLCENGGSADVDLAEHGNNVGLLAREKPEETSMHLLGDGKITSLIRENKLTNTKEELEGEGGNCSTIVDNKTVDCTCEKIAACSTKASNLANNILGDGCDNDTGTSKISEKLGVEESSVSTPVVKEACNVATFAEQPQPPVTEIHVDATDKISCDAILSSNVDEVPCSEIADSCKVKNSDVLRDTCLDPSDSAREEQTGPVRSSGTLLDENLERKEVVDEAPSALTTQDFDKCAKSIASKLSGDVTDKGGEIVSAKAMSVLAPCGPDGQVKLDFDLNEGFSGDDINQTEPANSSAPVYSPAICLPNLSHLTAGSISNGLRAPITVAAPAKGPFVPPENLMKNKGEPGWKGSAATSAFRPAEPRRVLDMPLHTLDVQSGKLARPPLEIDLNVPDERVLEDMASQCSPQTTGSESGAISNRDAPTRSFGGLDLDLNKVDEGTDNAKFLASTGIRLEVPPVSVKRVPNGEANMLRDFDLNGPGADEVGAETLQRSQHLKNNSSSIPFLPQISRVRMGNADLGNASSWFPHGNSYPAVAMPSFLADRGEQQPYPFVALPGAQRIFGSVTGGSGASGSDMYRGPVLSSSPAMAFPSNAAFPYAGFPFGSTFPLTSTSFPAGSTMYADSTGAASCFPAIPSQLVGARGAVSSPFARPYMVSLQEGSTKAASETGRKWERQGLDLNAGPGHADADAKVDRQQPSALRQLPIGSGQVFTDEQARMYQMSGVKRKEREGGSWDERFYKQPSWQ